MSDEIKDNVEEVKQDEVVQRALQRTTTKGKSTNFPAKGRDKFLLGTHVALLVVLAGLGYLLKFKNIGFVANYGDKLRTVIIASAIIVAVLAVMKLLDVYLLSRVPNTVYRYNLKRLMRLLGWLLIAFLLLTLFFDNWYTAVVSLGLISLILGFALQTPITSFIGWIYILVREPYRVGDRIRIGTAAGDVIDVGYLDTTLWEFGGDYLSTDHPSGRVIKFPNSTVLSSPVYNYTWPLFPYIWNEIKLFVAYSSDLEYVAETMQKVAQKEVGEAMLERVRVFRELLAQTPVDQVQVQEEPVVMFRVSENTWLEAVVRYLVHPKEAGQVKTRLIKDLLEELNKEPDRVRFPSGVAR